MGFARDAHHHADRRAVAVDLDQADAVRSGLGNVCPGAAGGLRCGRKSRFPPEPEGGDLSSSLS